MYHQPKVSFITPAFNRPYELKTAINSCLSQTIRDWEIVIVDDHSDKVDLKKLVSDFQDKRIRYIAQEKGKKGEAHGRQTAIENAQSDILITLDSDDINFPQRAARCLETLTNASPKLIYTRVMHFSASNPCGKPKKILQPYNSKLIEMINYITNPGTAFNRSAYELAGSFYNCNLDLATDYDQFLRMSRAQVNIIGLDEIHTCYRKHSNAVTSGNLKELHEAVMKVRVSNNVEPFHLEMITKYALPELSRSILDDEQQRALWNDDRWNMIK